jgi:hypothetical protein
MGCNECTKNDLLISGDSEATLKNMRESRIIPTGTDPLLLCSLEFYSIMTFKNISGGKC